jgi:aspartokinase
MKIPFLTPKVRPQINPPETDELVVGKVLSLELFKEYLQELGYDFQVFTDKDNKIYRFERYIKPDVDSTREFW